MRGPEPQRQQEPGQAAGTACHSGSEGAGGQTSDPADGGATPASGTPPTAPPPAQQPSSTLQGGPASQQPPAPTQQVGGGGAVALAPSGSSRSTSSQSPPSSGGGARPGSPTQLDGRQGEAEEEEGVLEARISTRLEEEIAAMLSGLPEAAAAAAAPPQPPLRPAPEWRGGPRQAPVTPWAPEPPPADRAGLPVLPDIVRNKDAKRELPLCCHILGCGVDLHGQADYYQRYRCCKQHLQAPALVVDDIVQRFCQQCGRFHVLSEFDGDKRNCRARLQQHNSRRRKVFAMSSELRRNRFVKRDAHLVDPEEGPPPVDLAALSASLAGASWPAPPPMPAPASGDGAAQPPTAGQKRDLAALLLDSHPPGAKPEPQHQQHQHGGQQVGREVTTGTRSQASPAASGGVAAPHSFLGQPVHVQQTSGWGVQPPRPPPASGAATLLEQMARRAMGQPMGPAGPTVWLAPPAARAHPEAQPMAAAYPELAAQIAQLAAQLQAARAQLAAAAPPPASYAWRLPFGQQHQQQQAGTYTAEDLLKAFAAGMQQSRAAAAPPPLPAHLTPLLQGVLGQGGAASPAASAAAPPPSMLDRVSAALLSGQPGSVGGELAAAAPPTLQELAALLATAAQQQQQQ